MTRKFPGYVGLAAFCVFSFFVLNWIYGYVIVLQGESKERFFMFGRQFLLDFIDHPAGLLRYAGRFLGQFYHYTWLGAAVVSLSITCFGVLFYGVLRKLRDAVHVSHVLYPCLLLLALHTSLIYMIFDTLGVATSCGAFLGYLSFRGRTSRRAYALLATPVLYGLLGAYFWLFVIWVAATEWLARPVRSGLAFKLAYIVFSVAVPIVAWRWVFPVPLGRALLYPHTFFMSFGAGPEVPISTYVDSFLAVVLYVCLLLIMFSDRLFSRTRLAALWRPKGGAGNALVSIARLAGLALLLHLVRYGAQPAAFAARRELYRQSQWDALLDHVRRDAQADVMLQFMTNFALYKKGRLLDEMFSYPQVAGTRGLVFNISGIVSDPAGDDTYMAMFNSDLFYEMGYVNLAFRHAYNHMCDFGRSYEAVTRIAQCSMVNGNYEMAAKYLTMLERTLFHRGVARRLRAVMADPAAAEREFGDIRKRRPVVEAAAIGPASLRVAAQILLENRWDNRMAFDYRMAWLLLERSVASLAEIRAMAAHFQSDGHASIPVHCQEALLLLEKQQRRPVDLHGLRYDDAVAARVTTFLEDLQRRGIRGEVRNWFRSQYGDTYMFYYFFGATPADVHRQKLN